jgi:hypothetical protein
LNVPTLRLRSEIAICSKMESTTAVRVFTGASARKEISLGAVIRL